VVNQFDSVSTRHQVYDRVPADSLLLALGVRPELVGIASATDFHEATECRGVSEFDVLPRFQKGSPWRAKMMRLDAVLGSDNQCVWDM
jgi:hypothetical protein